VEAVAKKGGKRTPPSHHTKTKREEPKEKDRVSRKARQRRKEKDAGKPT